LSLRATSTSATRPGSCAPIRTSPPIGSTRPAAEVAQPLLAAAFGLAELSDLTPSPEDLTLSIAGLALNVCGT
jgi:hypothetical protein